MKRMIVAMTGASGAVLGIRLLQALRDAGVETHLILSQWAEQTIKLETDYTSAQVRALAHVCYPADDLAAGISSGSFPIDGMVISPCSMKTLAAIASGFSYNLIARCADVSIKEGRRLVLVPRETPLSAIHLENLLNLSRLGAHILPPCMSFYTRPRTLEEAVEHFTGKTLDMLGIDNQFFRRWGGA